MAQCYLKLLKPPPTSFNSCLLFAYDKLGNWFKILKEKVFEYCIQQSFTLQNSKMSEIIIFVVFCDDYILASIEILLFDANPFWSWTNNNKLLGAVVVSNDKPIQDDKRFHESC